MRFSEALANGGVGRVLFHYRGHMKPTGNLPGGAAYTDLHARPYIRPNENAGLARPGILTEIDYIFMEGKACHSRSGGILQLVIDSLLLLIDRLVCHNEAYLCVLFDTKQKSRTETKCQEAA